jgi:hypothetical protein
VIPDTREFQRRTEDAEVYGCSGVGDGVRPADTWGDGHILAWFDGTAGVVCGCGLHGRQHRQIYKAAWRRA